MSEQQKEASGSLRVINADVNSLLANQLQALQLFEEDRSREKAQFEGIANSLKQIHSAIPSTSDLERLQATPAVSEDIQSYLHGTELEAVVALW